MLSQSLQEQLYVTNSHSISTIIATNSPSQVLHTFTVFGESGKKLKQTNEHGAGSRLTHMLQLIVI